MAYQKKKEFFFFKSQTRHNSFNNLAKLRSPMEDILITLTCKALKTS